MIHLTVDRDEHVEISVGVPGLAPIWVLTLDASGQITKLAAVSPDGSLSTRFRLVPQEAPAC